MSATTANIPMSSQFMPQEVGIQQALPVGRHQQAFPVRTFKVFGGVQIGLGVLLGILSLIGVISDKIAKNNTRFSFDMTCFICSGWHIFTGCLPMCMSKMREKRWTCLKTGFIVCSIIGASIFIPAMLSLGVFFNIIIIGNQDSKAEILSVFMAVLSFAEVVVAIIASSFCCCCSTWRTSIQEGVVISTQPGMFHNLPQTQIPMQNSHQVMIASGQTDNQIVQYSRGQQYQVIPTTQPTEQQV
ncbi:Hypothetical predicted protein [Mytilus galloprovincialis]|uniref:Uncharacterized protein n=1 Tax=Mytilus galloprovincialis TaxID=29158 RepID=A0A8B6FWH1_MYTGA|nr:Hypothetical predicted protein [Mytilus galloprovincialis]